MGNPDLKFQLESALAECRRLEEENAAPQQR
jgi:hypothetical protein